MRSLAATGLCLAALIWRASSAAGQVLQLPPRPADAVPGIAFAAEVTALDLRSREERIYAEVARGNVPMWLRQLVPVTLKRQIDKREITVTFWVTPDYLAVGSDTDYFLMPMSPQLAQRIADLTNSSLPTPPMVDAIWRSAAVRLGPDSIAPSAAMITVPVFADHNRMVRARRGDNSILVGALVAGHKKDVVLSARLDSLTNRVAIYGWHKPDGQPIQPLNTWHTTGHVDYSHGIRLVHATVQVDGVPRAITELLRDATMVTLLSDERAMRKARYDTTWP
jgi:hypothetical protein